jgi:septal ring factor EnvC (AmiA/AmiB activator)
VIDKIKHRLAIAVDWVLGNVVDARDLENAEVSASNIQLQIAELKDQRKAIEDQTAALHAEIDRIRAETATVDAELAAAKARVAELENNQVSASRKAIEICAAQGIPAGRLSAAGADATSDAAQLLQEFNAITDPEARGAFYAKHFAPKFQ